MKLYYHKGANFGDAINPMIFEKILGVQFDEDEEVGIVGIGSILGHFRPTEKTKRFYVFSSGFAGGDASTYGTPPEIKSPYEIICVRGKSTAKALGIDESYAVADGALLLPRLIDIPAPNLEHDYGYMPHVGSLDLYDDWKSVVESVGIHFIDPTKDPISVLTEMKKCKVIMTEAMHGAIICDAIRIPWIPIVSNKNINAFKWKDYLETVNLTYAPHHIPTLYSRDKLLEITARKVKFKPLSSIATSILLSRQSGTIKKVKNTFLSLKSQKTYLCDEQTLSSLQDQLLEKGIKLRKSLLG